MDFGEEFRARLDAQDIDYTVLGVVTGDRRVLPLGNDTKVLSTIFEAFARPIVYEIASDHDLKVWEPVAQNSYPDFTLMKGCDDVQKIAVDVKTTYRDSPDAKVDFTLGSYTSFIRPGNESKGIEFPYSEYVDDWIIGFVYSRSPEQRLIGEFYSVHELDTKSPPAPYSNVEVFVRRKWEVAGEVAGSGNTANIGSRRATVDELRTSEPLFQDKNEFLAYWRGYGKTKADRQKSYSSLEEFRRRA